ncbi:MAG: alpha/beta fold hydrolase [Gemmatimonadetes bacterium]|nr:alpha/beta fold hydrolase [Gemmatimonadota bacterium]
MKSMRATRGERSTLSPPPGPMALSSQPLENVQVHDGMVTLGGEMPLRMGGRIAPCRIAYRLIGAEGAPVVAVMGGISADRRACSAPGSDEPAGWWEGIVGPGRGLDLNEWRVLGIDFLAGPGGSSAPERPSEPGLIPPLTPGDQADALRAVADHLALPTLEAVMGASYGGAVALTFAADHADRTRRALVIGAAHRSHPLATALRVVQRRIVQDAIARGDEHEGLALSRVLAMTTYRSQEEFQRRFSGKPSVGPDGPRFPVEDYLDYHGQIFADRFDAMGFLCLSLSMDLHLVDPSRVGVPVTLVAMEPDSIAPAWQVRQLFELLGPGHELIEVPASCGHDSFLTDVDTFNGVVRSFLEKQGAR